MPPLPVTNFSADAVTEHHLCQRIHSDQSVSLLNQRDITVAKWLPLSLPITEDSERHPLSESGRTHLCTWLLTLQRLFLKMVYQSVNLSATTLMANIAKTRQTCKCISSLLKKKNLIKDLMECRTEM